MRTSSGDGVKNVLGILSLLVKRIRKDWPNTKITFRSDCGLCRDRTLTWCEKNNVYYIVGIPGNATLYKETEVITDLLQKQYSIYEQDQKVYTDFPYQAGTWESQRRVISEQNYRGSNIRFIVTNKDGSAKDLYTKEYCKRGDMENRIKELRLIC